MSHPVLTKSLLALAITSASLHLHAATYDVSQGAENWNAEPINESLTITGSTTAEGPVVELVNGTHIQGDLILDAQIIAKPGDDKNWAKGLDIDGHGDKKVIVDGKIQNKGNLSASGTLAKGMIIEGAEIGTGVFNDGTIKIADAKDVHDIAPGQGDRGIPAGIGITGAKVSGEVRNNGQITVEGINDSDVYGIEIKYSDLSNADVVNSNTGKINVSGEEAIGIEVAGGTVKSITNAGTIIATGSEEGVGISLSPDEVNWTEGTTVLGDLTNSGTIQAKGGKESFGIEINKGTIKGSLINSGSIEATGTSEVDGYEDTAGIVLEYDSAIEKDLINSGTILATGVSGDISGIILDETSVGGNVHNTSSGSITVSGSGEAAGILLVGASVDKDLTNDGSIKLNIDKHEAAGIQLSGSYEESYDQSGNLIIGELKTSSLIKGNLTNNGTIEVTGTGENIGILVEESSQINGDLINKGSIKVTSNGETAGIQLLDNSIGQTNLINTGSIEVDGTQAFGIDLSRVTAQSVNNSGSIKVNASEYGRGIYIEGSTLNTKLTNSGSITATGTQATGIYLERVDIKEGVHNSGTIKGDANGIWVKDVSNNPIQITQTAGLIQGGDYAIKVDQGNQVNLTLAGGTIHGTVIGVAKTDVTGKTTFADGQLQTSILNLSDKGALELALSNSTDANKAIILVDGKASFAEGSRLLLTTEGNNFRAEGKEYILVQADSIEDKGVSVSSSSALLNVDTHEIGNQQIKATVTGKSAVDAGNVIVSGGAGSNAQSAFTPFYSNVLSQLDDSDPIAKAFNGASSAAEVARLAEQLAPQIDGAASQAATGAQGLVSNAVSTRTSSLRGASAGSPFSQHGVWVQTLYSDARQGRRDGIAGYDADSKGVSFGIDGKLNDNLTLGAAYSYIETDVKSSGGNKTDVESHAFTLYSGYESGNLFADASLTYGANDNTGKRYIAGTTAKGKYDSKLYGLNLTAGYGLQFGQLTVEPRAAARYSRVDIDSFTEKGSSAALKQSSQRFEAIELGAGARFASRFQVGQGTLEPELRLMTYHDFAADKARSTSSYVMGGSPFVTNGAKPVRNSYEAGLGVNYRLGAVSLGAGYDYIGKSGYNADVVQLKLRYDF